MIYIINIYDIYIYMYHSYAPFKSSRIETFESNDRMSIKTIPKDNMSIQTIPKDNMSIQTIPKDNMSIQTIPKDNMSIQTIPKDNMSIRTIPKNDNMSIQTIPKNDRMSVHRIPKDKNMSDQDTLLIEKKLLEIKKNGENEIDKKINDFKSMGKYANNKERFEREVDNLKVDLYQAINVYYNILVDNAQIKDVINYLDENYKAQKDYIIRYAIGVEIERINIYNRKELQNYWEQFFTVSHNLMITHDNIINCFNKESSDKIKKELNNFLDDSFSRIIQNMFKNMVKILKNLSVPDFVKNMLKYEEVDIISRMKEETRMVEELLKEIRIPYFSDMHGRKIESIFITPYKNESMLLYVTFPTNALNKMRELMFNSINFDATIEVSSYGLLIDLPKYGNIMNDNTIISVKVLPTMQTVDYDVTLKIKSDMFNDMKKSNYNMSMTNKITAKPPPYDCLCK